MSTSEAKGLSDFVRILYTLLFFLLQPLLLLRLYWRSIKAPAYRDGIGQRFGYYPQRAQQQCIWVHAVSVGETIASVPLVRQLAVLYPTLPIVVSTTTPTGAERVDALLGDLVSHVYAPYDLPGVMRRFVRHFQPRVLIIIETELWPNMIHYCHREGVPVVLANARLSEKSATGYQRVGRLVRPMLEQLSAVAVQTDIEAQRFISLGLPPQNVHVTGNIKFDMQLTEVDRKKALDWRKAWCSNRQSWIAASTHEGEDEIILQAHLALLRHYPDLLLILVPRHPERFGTAVELSRDAGLKPHRLSTGTALAADAGVVIGDTMGDLLGLFGAARIAFVGGSLVPRGGHNLLEPALWAMPVLSGPHVFNFQEIADLMQAAGALQISPDALALENAIVKMLQSPPYLQELGARAYSVVEQNRGSLQRLIDVIVGVGQKASTQAFTQ